MSSNLRNKSYVFRNQQYSKEECEAEFDRPFSGEGVRIIKSHVFADKIDFLKVDIEGAEHHAFAGISDENLMKVKTISMEYHHSHFNYNEQLRQAFIDRLNKLGFNSYLMFMGTNNALQMLYFTR